MSKVKKGWGADWPGAHSGIDEEGGRKVKRSAMQRANDLPADSVPEWGVYPGKQRRGIYVPRAVEAEDDGGYTNERAKRDGGIVGREGEVDKRLPPHDGVILSDAVERDDIIWYRRDSAEGAEEPDGTNWD
jgi:hypothetical protein